MLRKLAAALGLGLATATASAEPPYAPYRDSAANEIYNLLFCDNPAAFKVLPGQSPADWQHTLFAEPTNLAALSTLANDASQEGRVRYLAYTRLRSAGQPVPAKVLLGVIVEVPLPGGLDVLAAFSDGGVRYVNQSGKLAFFEGAATLAPLVQALFEDSRTVVARIGPWQAPRKPPPGAGQIRLTLLVSDGLYFGEGERSVLQRDALAGPVIQRATDLLLAVVSLATKK